MAQKITSSVASASSFPHIPRTVPLQVFLPVTFDMFICILWWSHTSSSFSCGVFTSDTDRWEYGCCVPTELGNCMMLASVAMQGVFHAAFPGLSPWGPSSLLLKKQLVAQCEQLRSNNTPVACQQSSHLGSQLACKRRGPKVTMKNALESPVWKIAVVLFCGLGFVLFCFVFIDGSELAFSVGNWMMSRQTCQHPPAVLWRDAQSCQHL